ncbi:unnamed protein product [Urochloa decumbens]|uniref:DUF1618 domain-containing protein n=1 Tax=Urochloa decumbens TaxID=240449 RepID=A0ABC9C006_9POAL
MAQFPAPPVGPGGGSWLVLDRFIHRIDRDAEDGGDGTASELCYTCTDRPIRASIRVADPPAVSRLRLHWPGRREFRGLVEPHVIAAHDHAILFEATVPLEDPMCCGKTYSFPVDHFVYSAFSSPPSLHRLPVCFTGGVSTPDEDIYFKPYQRRQQRLMLEEEMGILCHGRRGEFTVVDFTKFGPEGELCLLHHRAPPPAPASQQKKDIEMQWRVKKVLFPKGPSAHYWITDTIVPVAGRFLCWVDCYQGILVVDVLHAKGNSSKDYQLRYIPLPEEALQSDRLDPDGDCPDPARRVGIGADGTLKLVCISRPRSAFTIRSWTLPDINQTKWLEGDTMGAAEFWGLCKGRGLPQVKPTFPLVSLAHPHEFFFLLEEDHTTYWIVEVNIRDKVLKSSAIYINEEEEGCTPDRARRNVFDGDSFIPSAFSCYLGMNATKSYELSKMMQKEKQLRVAQRKSRPKV